MKHNNQNDPQTSLDTFTEHLKTYTFSAT